MKSSSVFLAAVICLTLTNAAFGAPKVSNATKKKLPVANARITSSFGKRTHPVTGRAHFHNGVDLSARLEQSVKSVLDGIVVRAGRRGLLGNAVEILHPEANAKTIYGHLNSVSVRAGQKVKQGARIGGAGTTGRSTGVHVHFTVKNARTNAPMNPLAFLNGRRGQRTMIASNKSTPVPSKSKAKKSAPIAKEPRKSTASEIAAAPRKPSATEIAAELASRKQLFASAKEKVVAAQQEADKYKMLYEEGAVSRNDMQSKIAALSSAQQELRAVEG